MDGLNSGLGSKPRIELRLPQTPPRIGDCPCVLLRIPFSSCRFVSFLFPSPIHGTTGMGAPPLNSRDLSSSCTLPVGRVDEDQQPSYVFFFFIVGAAQDRSRQPVLAMDILARIFFFFSCCRVLCWAPSLRTHTYTLLERKPRGKKNCRIFRCPYVDILGCRFFLLFRFTILVSLFFLASALFWLGSFFGR